MEGLLFLNFSQRTWYCLLSRFRNTSISAICVRMGPGSKLEHANSSSSNLSSSPLTLSMMAGSLSLDLSDVYEENQIGITLLTKWVAKAIGFSHYLDL